MKKPLLVFILATSCTLSVTAQSGRRIARPAPAAPIQPPLTTEPERPTAPPSSSELFLLPESLRERQIKTLDKGSFRLADFHGKVIVINLWASWCGPCQREVPEYEKVRQDYTERNVEFIGLTTEDPRTSAENVNRFLRSVKFGFRLGWADRETARALMNGRNSIPQTLVIDATGRVVKHWTGYAPRHSGERLRQTIEHALLTTEVL